VAPKLGDLLFATVLFVRPMLACAEMTPDDFAKEKKYAEMFGDDVQGAYQCGHTVEAERYAFYLWQWLKKCSGATDQQIDEIAAMYKTAKPAACSQVKLGSLDAMTRSNRALAEVGCKR
jgi:hypothetical protein